MRVKLLSAGLLLAVVVTWCTRLGAQEPDEVAEQGEQHPLRVLAKAAVEAEIQVRATLAGVRKAQQELGLVQRSVEKSFRAVRTALERQFRDGMQGIRGEDAEQQMMEFRQQMEECEARWRDDQGVMGALGERRMEQMGRTQALSEAYRMTRELAERWKDAGLDTALIVPLFGAMQQAAQVDRAALGETQEDMAVVESTWRQWREELVPEEEAEEER